MASKRRNMFYEDMKQGATEIVEDCAPEICVNRRVQSEFRLGLRPKTLVEALVFVPGRRGSWSWISSTALDGSRRRESNSGDSTSGRPPSEMGTYASPFVSGERTTFGTTGKIVALILPTVREATSLCLDHGV
ncbi:hypothetical protein AAG570_004975 [Ranatra chinensis]|uniref:Uncharacterized protein n=1 Tax=Ranatra chinensis TaxID=642074 RepID=A0ABD0YE09_9HEMI